MSAWTFLVLTMGVVIAPFLPISHATAKDGWTSQHFQDHPLAGTIWNSDFEAVTISELEKRFGERALRVARRNSR